eukprot:4504744-Pyramimonas_sp.AAC.1
MRTWARSATGSGTGAPALELRRWLQARPRARQGLSPCVNKISVLLDAPISPHSPVEPPLKGVSLATPIHLKCTWWSPTKMP